MGFEVDFLTIPKDGIEIEIEIECKYLSADVGRKIHRHKPHLLFDLLLPMLVANADALRNGQVLIVEVPGRLKAGRERMDEIVTLAAAAINAPTRRAESNVGIVSLEGTTTPAGPRKKWNSGEHYGGRFRNIGVILRSAKDDGVIDQIKRNLLKDAKRQFFKRRPPVLFANVSDLSGAQLAALRRAPKDGMHAVQ